MKTTPRRVAARLLPAGFLSACLLAASAGAQAQCLSDAKDREALAGVVSTGQFRDAAGRPQSAFILTLKTPACLDSDDADMRVKQTLRVHIYSTRETVHAQIRQRVGKSVRVRGKPFGAHTGHHHAPIVMDVAVVE